MVVLKELDSMFWALFLESGKRYSQKVERSFHISMAALEIPTDHDQLKSKQNKSVSVMVGMDKGEFLLSSLNYKFIYQQPLDLNFNSGDEVTFFLNGEGNVHLTGYLMEDEPDLDSSMFDDEDIGDSEEEDSDEDVPDLVPSKGAKRKKESASQPTKKLKWISDEAEEEDSDEDSDEEMDSDMDDEMLEFEDYVDDDEDDEESDVEEVVPKKKEKQTPKADKTPKQNKQQKQDQQKSGKKENKNAQQVKSAPSTPANQAGPDGDAGESKKKKKKKKKNKGNEAESTPQQSKPEQKSQTPSQTQTPNKTPKKQVLAGGTVMEEIRPGTGPVAKSGKMVHVYYVGKLQKGDRQFDSCTSGKPFRFRLGGQEVIKGWDAGLQGMKVGGKRKLVIPAQQAYGNQKMGGIPPNSTLVFEVELKNIT